MKFTGLLFVAVACFGASYAHEIKTENGVFVLNADNYKQAVAEFDRFFVAMYAPWCGWCSLLLPEMDIAAAKLKEMKSDAKIAKVDCTQNEELCNSLQVEYYPTTKIYDHGVPTEYEGERTADDIVAALVNKVAVDAATFSGFCKK